MLAVHNVDDCMRGNEWMRVYRVGRMGTRCAVRALVVGMVLAAIWVAGMAYETGGWVWASRAPVFAMLLNGLGHGLLSVKRREVVPGTVSAALLVVPYAVLTAVSMLGEPGSSPGLLLGYAALGAVGMPVVIALCLALGSGGCWGIQKVGVVFRKKR